MTWSPHQNAAQIRFLLWSCFSYRGSSKGGTVSFTDGFRVCDEALSQQPDASKTLLHTFQPSTAWPGHVGVEVKREGGHASLRDFILIQDDIWNVPDLPHAPSLLLLLNPNALPGPCSCSRLIYSYCWASGSTPCLRTWFYHCGTPFSPFNLNITPSTSRIFKKNVLIDTRILIAPLIFTGNPGAH